MVNKSYLFRPDSKHKLFTSIHKFVHYLVHRRRQKRPGKFVPGRKLPDRRGISVTTSRPTLQASMSRPPMTSRSADWQSAVSRIGQSADRFTHPVLPNNADSMPTASRRHGRQTCLALRWQATPAASLIGARISATTFALRLRADVAFAVQALNLVANQNARRGRHRPPHRRASCQSLTQSGPGFYQARRKPPGRPILSSRNEPSGVGVTCQGMEFPLSFRPGTRFSIFRRPATF